MGMTFRGPQGSRPTFLRVTAGGAWRALMLLIALFFAGSILCDILRYGVNVPFWDQWDAVAAVRRASSDGISWPRMFFLSGPQSLGHQFGVDVVLSVLTWNLTHMNMVAIMVLNWTFALGLCVLGMWVTKKALPPGSSIPWLVLAAGSFFIFNPAAYQIWLWGLQPIYLLIPLLFFAGIAGAQSRASNRTKIVAAAACAFFASFILGSGLLLWLLFPFVLAHYLKPSALKTERLAVLLYAALGAVCVVIYGIGALHYRNPLPANGPSGPGVLARFFFAYTGNLVSLSAESTPVLWAELAGLVLTCLFLALVFLAFREFYRKKEWPVVAIWSCLGFYSLASGVLVAFGRHRFGVAYAVDSSRYVLASAFLPVAIVALACVLIGAFSFALPSRLRLYSGTLCVTVALLLTCAGFRYLQWSRASLMMAHSYFWQMSGKVAVASANLFPLPEFRNIYPNDDRSAFLLSASFLNVRGWLHPAMWDDAFLRDLASPQRRPEPGYGSVESFVADGGKLQLGGWAYLADRHERAHAIIVLALESGHARVLSVLFPSLLRGDVFERLHDWEALSSGWKAEIPAASLGTQIRCFAYDALTGQAHLLAGTGFAELAAPLRSATVAVVGSWTRDGYYPDVGRPPVDDAVFGSWSGADSNTGTLRLGPFHLDGRAGIALPLVTGPQNTGLSVRILDAATKKILADLPPRPSTLRRGHGSLASLPAVNSPSKSLQRTRAWGGGSGKPWGGRICCANEQGHSRASRLPSRKVGRRPRERTGSAAQTAVRQITPSAAS